MQLSKLSPDMKCMFKCSLGCYNVQLLYKNGFVAHARQVKSADEDLRSLSAPFQLAPEVGFLLGRGQVLLSSLPGYAAVSCLRGLKSAARLTASLRYW